MGVPMAHDKAYYEAEKKIEEALKSDTKEPEYSTFDNCYPETKVKVG